MALYQYSIFLLIISMCFIHWFYPDNKEITILFFVIDLGLQEHRLDGDEYVAVIDEFMEAVFTRWPHVIVQVI